MTIDFCHWARELVCLRRIFSCFFTSFLVALLFLLMSSMRMFVGVLNKFGSAW